METLKSEVVIVGAGPAGLTAAIALALQGVDFVILDCLAAGQNTSRAAAIHAATLQSMAPLGLDNALIAQGLKVPSFRVRDRDHALLHADFSQLQSRTPYVLLLPQDETEAIMRARLAELGHGIRRPVRVTAVERTAPRASTEPHTEARVYCTGEQGDFRIAARYVIGADGEHSTVRPSTGIGFPGKTYGSFLLADVRMDWPIARDEISLFFSQAGPLVVIPLPQERFRIVTQLADAPSQPTVSDVKRVLDARGPHANSHLREILWGSRFQVHHKLADRFRDGPVLLVGDAAHVHSPVGGQGMNLGIRDAAVLADALTAALRSHPADALDNYALTRRQAASQMLAMTERLTCLVTLESSFLRLARNSMISFANTFPFIGNGVARRLAGLT